ncbi:hypothetical protein [Flagellimonas sp.]|uniref:hypothetical protein n=1 Tax=Flagellimonas sp. TaxID=2058762 RepID=UPI003BA9FCC5
MGSIIHYGDVAFASGSRAAFAFGSGTKEHTTINPEDKTSGVIAKWGDDNQYPQKFKKALNLNGAGGAALRVLRSTHYGQGFHLYKDSAVNGKRDKEIVSIKDYNDINTFFRRCRMNRFWTETIADLETYYIAFPEFILTKDFNTIYSVRRLQSAKCRFEKINPKTGLIENVYFCHNWSSYTNESSEYVEKIAAIDSYWTADQIKEYCRKKRIYKFVLPIFYPLMNETYYPEVDWHAVYHNGWMNVANSIPEYKKNLFEQQLNVKYMVYISEEYFLRMYPNEWNDYTPEKKKELRDQLTKAIDDHLSGNKNAGKSIQSVVYKDRNDQWVKGIEVVPVEDKLKDGSYLPEASAANSEIMFAMGVDPSIVGAGIPGGKMNTGSGSDKREAFSILTSLFKTKREISLEPWQLLRDYNGWDPELEAEFANTKLTTLDSNPMGVETTI